MIKLHGRDVIYCCKPENIVDITSLKGHGYDTRLETVGFFCVIALRLNIDALEVIEIVYDNESDWEWDMAILLAEMEEYENERKKHQGE